MDQDEEEHPTPDVSFKERVIQLGETEQGFIFYHFFMLFYF